MEAAIHLLTRDGVLAGLSLQEVADTARSNRALIHRYFGGRRGLLRAALDRRKRAMAPLAATLRLVDPKKRSVQSFPGFTKDPSFAAIVMLLALDGDDAFEPLPYFTETINDLAAEQRAGVWVESADLLALTVIVEVFIYGYFVMRPSIARQLEMSLLDLDRRVETALSRIAEAFLEGAGGSSP